MSSGDAVAGSTNEYEWLFWEIVSFPPEWRNKEREGFVVLL